MEMTVDDFAKVVVRVSQYNRTWRGQLHPIVLTFDDGYRDNLELAVPLLEEHKQCATFFITGSKYHHSDPFWWEQVPLITSQSTRDWLEIELPNKKMKCDMRTQVGRDRAALAISKSLRPHRQSVITKTLCSLKDQVGDLELFCPPRLTENEIRELASIKGMTIGGHTEHHEFLSTLTPTEVSHTVNVNLDWLEVLAGERPRVFAYPFGSRASVAGHVFDSVRSCSIEKAYVNWPASIIPNLDRYRIPRKVAT